ncbi:hypothetical protein [Paenibacillus arenilitoris]|uniref:Uncharacterized protein n=1 Tax=Paenibacillus arenilitoris TaxID=2772299 RepID=A0A927CLI6_9BACL|nr:hypothetical protein [Paenibacillus arenilitoris]MBD2869017.1 hypothetical protein [Paenibacillus arenilitoris]
MQAFWRFMRAAEQMPANVHLFSFGKQEWGLTSQNACTNAGISSGCPIDGYKAALLQAFRLAKTHGYAAHSQAFRLASHLVAQAVDGTSIHQGKVSFV